MAMGVYCDSCKHKELEHKFDKWPCMDCCDGDRRDPVRNADRIRAMTDEELAEFMNCGACPPGKDVSELCHDEDGGSVPDMCNLCWLDWLKEEAKE